MAKRRRPEIEFSESGWPYADNEYSGGASSKPCTELSYPPCSDLAVWRVRTYRPGIVATAYKCEGHMPEEYRAAWVSSTPEWWLAEKERCLRCGHFPDMSECDCSCHFRTSEAKDQGNGG